MSNAIASRRKILRKSKRKSQSKSSHVGAKQAKHNDEASTAQNSFSANLTLSAHNKLESWPNIIALCAGVFLWPTANTLFYQLRYAYCTCVGTREMADGGIVIHDIHLVTFVFIPPTEDWCYPRRIGVTHGGLVLPTEDWCYPRAFATGCHSQYDYISLGYAISTLAQRFHGTHKKTFQGRRPSLDIAGQNRTSLRRRNLTVPACFTNEIT